jgi:hypothetical protein
LTFDYTISIGSHKLIAHQGAMNLLAVDDVQEHNPALPDLTITLLASGKSREAKRTCNSIIADERYSDQDLVFHAKDMDAVQPIPDKNEAGR